MQFINSGYNDDLSYYAHTNITDILIVICIWFFRWKRNKKKNKKYHEEKKNDKSQIKTFFTLNKEKKKIEETKQITIINQNGSYLQMQLILIRMCKISNEHKK